MAEIPILRCIVITPETQAVDAEAKDVMLPAHDGLLGVLPGHAPFLCKLGMGLLRYRDMKSQEHAVFIENGFGHVSTFGGAEPGCQVASRVLDICSDPALLASVRKHAAILGDGFADLKGRYSFLKEIRQCGLVIGLRYDDPLGAVSMCKALYQNGIWAMIAGFDYSAMQCKPWLFLDRPLIDDILTRFEDALKICTP